MQKCPCCGKEIKYIATSDRDIVTCNTQETTIYNNFGRKIVGYTIHVCEEVKDEGQEQN